MTKKYQLHVLSLLPFIITAVFSAGFLHPDEHFVTLELLQTKISNFTRPEIFNWDFHEKIRPWFQTFIYFLLYKVVPIESPFQFAVFLRILHGVLGWFSLYQLIKYYEKNKEKQLKILTYVSWTWFIPFLMVRTSSESLSISLFFLGIPFFLKQNSSKNSIIAGLLWGASFLARFQMGILIAAASIYFFRSKKHIKLFCVHSLTIFLMIGVGLLIDFWGYEQWSFTPYNYLYTNIFESRASDFGTDPFWFYIYKPIIKGGVLIPLFFIFGAFTFFKANKKNIWPILLGSFLFIHSIIPHKEVRFLSFIYVAIVALTFIQSIEWKFLKHKIVVTLLLTINFLMMTKASLTPAEGLLSLYKAANETKVTTFYTPKNSQGAFFKFQMPFYEKIRRNTIGFDINKISEIPSGSTIITTNFNQFKILNTQCERKWLSYPEFVLKLNYFNWVKRSAITAIWKCGT